MIPVKCPISQEQNETKPRADLIVVLANNYFGRQFNSLNDVSVNPRNGDIYFTDTQYGYWQYFRPEPGLPNQVYRLNPATGALTVVSDAFVSPNGMSRDNSIALVYSQRAVRNLQTFLCAGLTFSPDGSYAYVTDTGMSQALFGVNMTKPATVYASVSGLSVI